MDGTQEIEKIQKIDMIEIEVDMDSSEAFYKVVTEKGKDGGDGLREDIRGAIAAPGIDISKAVTRSKLQFCGFRSKQARSISRNSNFSKGVCI